MPESEGSGTPDPVPSKATSPIADRPGEPRRSARLDRTAEFRVPRAATTPPSAPDEFEIQVRRVQGHWISKVRAQVGHDGSRLYAGLGDTVAKSLLELARHLDSDVALEELEELSSRARYPRRERPH